MGLLNTLKCSIFFVLVTERANNFSKAKKTRKLYGSASCNFLKFFNKNPALHIKIQKITSANFINFTWLEQHRMQLAVTYMKMKISNQFRVLI